ncbi:MAG: L-rhamnose mutarotase, partial [Gaiellales bacterium]
SAGWLNYSLFLTDTGQVIGYLECDDFDACLTAMAGTDVNERWQAEMAPFFEGLGGKRADEGMQLVTEIFHLD